MKPSKEKIVLRPAHERGLSQFPWLNSFHTFSFGDYSDPRYMGFRTLRIINDDTVAPSQGFGMHSHNNMEIISYIIAGSLEHKDSMGNGSVLHAGDFQRITSGTGISHSEFNPSSAESVHFLQMWIIPEKKELRPSYQQLSVPENFTGLKLIASHLDTPGQIKIHQDAKISLGRLPSGQHVRHFFENPCGIWVQMITGEIALHYGDSLDNPEYSLKEGDGIGIENEKEIRIQAVQKAEFLIFNLQ